METSNGFGLRVVLSRVVLTGISALLALGCSGSSRTIEPTTPPSSLAGCYNVTFGVWSGPRDSADPPGRITLLDSLGTNLLESGQSLARPDPIGAGMPFDMAWWTRPALEHLEVVFTNGGFTGVRMHLVWGWGDSTWGGTAEAFTDVSPSVQAVTTARLSPERCG